MNSLKTQAIKANSVFKVIFWEGRQWKRNKIWSPSQSPNIGGLLRHSLTLKLCNSDNVIFPMYTFPRCVLKNIFQRRMFIKRGRWGLFGRSAQISLELVKVLFHPFYCTGTWGQQETSWQFYSSIKVDFDLKLQLHGFLSLHNYIWADQDIIREYTFTC